MNPTLAASTVNLLLAATLTLSVGKTAVAQFTLGQPTNLGQPVNTATWEYAPQLSTDGYLLYYQSGCRCNGDNPEIYVATRESANGPWMNPQPIGSPINTNADELSPSLSLDGQQLYFSDGFRPDFSTVKRPDGMGSGDIWVSSWNEATEGWDEPQNFATVNSIYRDYAPDISADGLEFYFSSNRPEGSGNADIWVSRREKDTDPWGPPENVSVINSGSHEDFPSISNDGLKLFFGSSRSGGIGRASDLWVSTRARIEDEWGPPAHLGRLNGTYWNLEPELSADGTMLYYGRWDPEPGGELWQVPVLPLESVPLTGGGGEYSQTFDEALSADGTQGQTLPTGWAVTNNGIVFENKTTDDFPLQTGDIIPRRLVSAFNAGVDQEVDRSLAIAVAPSTDAASIQFMTQVEESDALSFQLQFDVEAWDSESFARDPGEAAFDVRLEIDSGDGFSLLRDLGTVTTGNDLSRPTGDYLDGNLAENRESFNSGIVPTRIPAGSRLRVLWEANTAAETRGWVFGLDNISLNLFETGSFKSGDFNEDGLLDVADMDALTAEVLAGFHPTQYDLNQDGMVDEGDRTIWITDIKNTYFGDSNLDGAVNAADLNAVALNWRSEMATSWSQGDFNGDGNVSALDLNDLALNWRSGSVGAASAHAVPEPSCAALLLLGVLVLVRARSGRTRPAPAHPGLMF